MTDAGLLLACDRCRAFAHVTGAGLLLACDRCRAFAHVTGAGLLLACGRRRAFARMWQVLGFCSQLAGAGLFARM